MNLYKTQNIFFDLCLDKVKAKSIEQVFHLVDQEICKDGAVKVKNGVVIKALESEQSEHGFSVMNGVLVCNANVKAMNARKTIFMRLERPITAESIHDQPFDMVACTISPERLGILGLRYLSRLTRFFGDKQLIENLHAVNSTDGMDLLLNDVKPLEKDEAA
ncbi:MAG: PTS sugar transporter subunit IIA [Bdellovibrionales bacterium]